MGLHVSVIGIVDIVGAYQFNSKLLSHAVKLLIHVLLIRNPVVLKLKKEIVLAKTILVFQSKLFGFLILTSYKGSRNLSRQTGCQTNQTLMVLFQGFKVHTWSVIISFCVSDGYNLHKVVIALVVLCQQNQMVVAVLSVTHLSVKSGSWSHIHLTAYDGIDFICLAGLIELYHTVHIAMVCDSGTIHAKLLHSGHIVFYFVGSIQQGIFCMSMKMTKSHVTTISFSTTRIMSIKSQVPNNSTPKLIITNVPDKRHRRSISFLHCSFLLYHYNNRLESTSKMLPIRWFHT